ncbi:hypothetical protein PHYPSEUDO_006458 [Phytophthora pseudosyringae]|uniref:FYVE-type domain-containing protein n=1 Tax=Phytophthora pseudosyringae TaxID=221518 RepID=A0A8T1VM10_9STRA|nr:hypothetical protein PHYPSEUDO_006458 [Phytophthora pseudosyringae]
MRSVRLHLAKHRESAASSSATTESVASSWGEGEAPPPPLPLSAALRDFVAEAEALHDRGDFASFISIAESPRLPYFRDGQAQWKRVERSPTYTLLKRESEVLALARLDASVEEVASILGATTDQLHASTMRGLYGDAFITGSVAYVLRPRGDQQVTVKATSFVHSDMLGKNEQWCVAESLRCQPDGDSFTLTQASLSAPQARSLPARSALQGSSRRVAQLRGVTAAYFVERLPGTHGLRVVFHALHKVGATTDESEAESPTLGRKAVRARLLRLASGISQLSQLARRRRFGTQVYADRSAFDERNPRCTCCTRKLTMLISRTRCSLCGYYVCVACASSENMETRSGRLTSAIVCSRCCESVAACDYEHMLTVLPGPERVLPDPMQVCPLSPTAPSRMSELSNFSSASSDSSSSQMLADLLDEVVDDVTASGRRHAAFMVLNQLIAAGQNDTQVQVDKNAQLLRKASASPRSMKAAAKQALDVSKCPKDLEACNFASADSRPYPMVPALVQHEVETKEAEPMKYPIPSNEAVRLAAIEHFRLHDIANVPEVNVICSLAAAEMGVPHSVLTLVEREVVTLLATNAPESWDVGSGNPREQTFCQHFVMDDQPLLVRHAEADMRFYNIAPVTLRSLRFYAGFPVSVPCMTKASGEPERVVVGALCCLDAKPHQMTRSQYWRLMKLADAASSILERNAKEFLADPKSHPLSQNRVGVQASSAPSNATAAVAC